MHCDCTLAKAKWQKQEKLLEQKAEDFRIAFCSFFFFFSLGIRISYEFQTEEETPF